MTKKNWKKDPIMCYNENFCGKRAVAENGDGHWYCLSCFEDMLNDEDIEVDDSLSVCYSELERQYNK